MSQGQKEFFETFSKASPKNWEECFEALYAHVVKERVAAIDSCISAVTTEENKCENRVALKAINRIQIQLLRQRLAAAMPVLKPRERALAAEALEETVARPVRRARKKSRRK